MISFSDFLRQVEENQEFMEYVLSEAYVPTRDMTGKEIGKEHNFEVNDHHVKVIYTKKGGNKYEVNFAVAKKKPTGKVSLSDYKWTKQETKVPKSDQTKIALGVRTSAMQFVKDHSTEADLELETEGNTQAKRNLYAKFFQHIARQYNGIADEKKVKIPKRNGE